MSSSRASSTAPERAPRQRRVRTVTELLASVVLGFEAVVVFLGTLVIFGLHALPPISALVGGWGLALVMLVTVALLRWSAGRVIGWACQLLVVLAGFIQVAMFFVGIVFVAAWTFAMIAGARLDKEKAK